MVRWWRRPQSEAGRDTLKPLQVVVGRMNPLNEVVGCNQPSQERSERIFGYPGTIEAVARPGSQTAGRRSVDEWFQRERWSQGRDHCGVQAQSEVAMLRSTMMIVATMLVLGCTVFSAPALEPPPPPAPIRVGGGPVDGGDHKATGGHQSGIAAFPDGERAFRDRLRVGETGISAKWEDVQFRMRPEEKTIATCRTDMSSCPEAARRFFEIVELGRQREGRARLGEVNRAVNLRIKPASDWLQHGVDDFWSTPLTTLGRGAGDCEDYAILKYAALRELGLAADDMRLLIVRDRRNSNHAVLAVRDDNQWLILDNRTLVLAKAEDVRHYFYLIVLDYRGTRSFEAVAFR